MVAALTTCIRTNLDCADVCDTTGRVLSRRTGYDAIITRAVLQACLRACRSPARNAFTTRRCTSTAGCAPSLPAVRSDV